MGELLAAVLGVAAFNVLGVYLGHKLGMPRALGLILAGGFILALL